MAEWIEWNLRGCRRSLHKFYFVVFGIADVEPLSSIRPGLNRRRHRNLMRGHVLPQALSVAGRECNVVEPVDRSVALRQGKHFDKLSRAEIVADSLSIFGIRFLEHAE